MSIDKADIEKIATLSRLKVSDAEATELTGRLGDILTMVDTMQAVDTTGIEPMANPQDATQRLRSDVVSEADVREQFQAIAPAAEDGLYLVPKVIE
jgi:aspartyl-tRNA(Asn)/glutamyl-tRNA(Gln) amidotransferase subunit C